MHRLDHGKKTSLPITHSPEADLMNADCAHNTLTCNANPRHIMTRLTWKIRTVTGGRIFHIIEIGHQPVPIRLTLRARSKHQALVVVDRTAVVKADNPMREPTRGRLRELRKKHQVSAGVTVCSAGLRETPRWLSCSRPSG